MTYDKILKENKQKTSNKQFTVIIRNRNEERYIGFSIQSVLDHLKDPEILIIDNNSTDRSIEIAKSFNFANITICRINDYTPGDAINMGVNNATCENLLILSAHSQIVKLSDENVINNLNHYGAVFGRQIPIWNGRKINPRYIWSHFIQKDVTNMFSSIEGRYFLHNAFSFFKKEILLEHPFDRTLYGKEDRYWANDRVNNGFNIFYDHNSICHHHFTNEGATWRGIG